MHTHHIKLKRSPRSVSVGTTTTHVGKVAGVEQKCRPNATKATTARAEEIPPQVARPRSPSVATVITNPVDRSVTPLSRSSAVPVLSNGAHQVVTAAEVGFNGIDPEDVQRLQQLLINAAEEVSELKTQNRQSLGEMQEVAVELATAAASWLVGFALERNLFAVDDLILKAFEHLELNDTVKVRLHPADHDLLQSMLPDSSSRKQLEQLTCIPDESLARGSVRVESGRRIVLTDMHSRLEEIRRSWMEKLDDSQIERRGDGQTSRTLRRFPERRETA